MSANPTTLEEAIVLRRIPFGDSSLVIHFFTPARGRVPMLVKGAFRPKSPFFGSLDLLDRVELEIIARKESAMAVPGDFHFVTSHRRLRGRLPELTAALYSAELIDAVLAEAPQPQLFARFHDWLEDLDRAEAHSTGQLALALLSFELGFVDDLGLQPAFDRCADCGKELSLAAAGGGISVRAGGLVCESCRVRWTDAVPFSRDARALTHALRTGQHTAASPAAVRELRSFLDRFLKFHLEYLPKARPSLEFLWH
jgi:DNA repair protein RecO (recombination protein O)